MKSLPLILSACVSIFLFYTCTSEKHENNAKTDPSLTEEGKLEKEINSLALNFGLPVQIKDSPYIIFPVTAPYTNKPTKSSYPRSSYSEPFVWNLLFYNKETKDQYLLSEEIPMIINSFYIKKEIIEPNKEDTSYNLPENTILYSIIIHDFNKDGKLTRSDPSYLFISDNKGKNLKQITPHNYDVKSWTFIQDSSELIIFTNKDTNKDREFYEDDDTTLMTFNFISDSIAKPIVANNTSDKLKKLFYNQHNLKN